MAIGCGRRAVLVSAGAVCASVTSMVGSGRAESHAVATTAYIGSSGYINAIDAESGTVTWRFSEPDGAVRTPLVVDGTLFAGAMDSAIFPDVYALDAATGEKRWEYSHPDIESASTPSVVGGVAYVGARTRGDRVKNVLALDAETGEELWSTDVPGYARNPAIWDDSVFVPTFEGIVSLDRETGEELWAITDGSPNSPGLTVRDDRVYASTEDELLVLDAETGEEVWSFSHSMSFARPPTVVGGLVYFGGGGGQLFAIDADSGEKQWDLPTGEYSPAVVESGRVYTQSERGLLALEADSGDPVWGDRDLARTYTRVGPTVHEGVVYVPGNKLHALDADDGDQRWSTSDVGMLRQSAATVVEDPEDGSSVDALARYGIFAHHDDVVGSSDDDFFGIPGFGPIAGVAGIGTAAYLLGRRHDRGAPRESS